MKPRGRGDWNKTGSVIGTVHKNPGQTYAIYIIFLSVMNLIIVALCNATVISNEKQIKLFGSQANSCMH